LCYDHVPVYFFVLRIYTSLKKHHTSNTYNEVTSSILQFLNSRLQDVPVPAPHILQITLFCSLNVGIRGQTIKFANSPPCACCGSTGLITLTYQCFTAVLLLIYGSLFLNGIYYYLRVLVCHWENVRAWIRAM